MVSINILNYNTFEKSCICIDSCLNQQGVNYQILLIDNASTDDSYARLQARYGNNIEYYQTGTNYGYAGGNNKGVEYCYSRGFEYAFLLNSDTEIKGAALLSELQNIAVSNSNCAVVSPTIFDVTKAGLIKHTNDYFYNKMLRKIKVLPPIKDITDKVELVSEAHGAAMLVDCKKFLEVGGFPEHYFMYCEESTFAKKILWAGYDILWYKDDNSCIYHHHDKTVSVAPWREYLMGRNRVIEYFENRNKHSHLWYFIFKLFQLKMYIEGIKTKNMHYYYGMENGRSLIKQKASKSECYSKGVEIQKKLIDQL